MLERDISYAHVCFLCCWFGGFPCGGEKPRLASGSLGWRSSGCAGLRATSPAPSRDLPVHPAGARDASCTWDGASALRYLIYIFWGWGRWWEPGIKYSHGMLAFVKIQVVVSVE